MKAAVLYQPGGAENFVLEDRPIPTPQPGWILLQIKAFGLNRSELVKSFPTLPGSTAKGSQLPP